MLSSIIAEGSLNLIGSRALSSQYEPLEMIFNRFGVEYRGGA
jgi:hypothetical protein